MNRLHPERSCYQKYLHPERSCYINRLHLERSENSKTVLMLHETMTSGTVDKLLEKVNKLFLREIWEGVWWGGVSGFWDSDFDVF